MAGVKREAQRRRTRTAIIEAAAELLAQGKSPSIAEIAAAADVSRRTVYMYFTSLDHLLADAALEVTRSTVEPSFELAGTAPERLEAMVRALQSNALATEELGRTIIRHTIESAPPGDPTGGPRRGYRRVRWIEEALEPARTELGAERFERLVSALTLLIGWEPVIVLRDIRGLSAAESEEISAWAAGALLASALAEAEAEAR
jgi:AcrR family transcriptional regulator